MSKSTVDSVASGDASSIRIVYRSLLVRAAKKVFLILFLVVLLACINPYILPFGGYFVVLIIICIFFVTASVVFKDFRRLDEIEATRSLKNESKGV